MLSGHNRLRKKNELKGTLALGRGSVARNDFQNLVFQCFLRLLFPFYCRFKAPLQIYCSHPCCDPPGLSVPTSVETSRGCSQISVLCSGEWKLQIVACLPCFLQLSRLETPIPTPFLPHTLLSRFNTICCCFLVSCSNLEILGCDI